MGLFGPRRQERFFGITGAEDLIPSRTGGSRLAGNVVVTDSKALRHSAVWACTRLRASLISTFPLDVFRDVLGIQTETTKPLVLTNPGGTQLDFMDFMFATQADLDRAGNAVGLIVERSAVRTVDHPRGLPARIELQESGVCTYVKPRRSPPFWRIDGEEYDVADVWHESQFRLSGAIPVGLSTMAAAAMSIGEGLSMQKFALDWFDSGGVPKARMRNTAKRLQPEDVLKAKQWFRDTIQHGDLLVTGSDWEYDVIQSQQMGMEWLEGRNASALDVCRFMNVPGDMVDVNPSGQSVTYANITQRNLQFLIHHLGPTVAFREKNLSKLLPRPRYVKLNTDALLRMDPETRAKVLKINIVDSKLLTNTEGRALENRKPLTDVQRKELVDIYGPPKGSTPAAPVDDDQEDVVPAGVGR